VSHDWSARLKAEWEQRGELALALVLSLLVSATVVAFVYLTEQLGARYFFPAGHDVPWRRLIVPAVGALLGGYLLWRYFPEARGSGIPQTKVAMVAREGYISFRTAVGKFFCCSLSLGSGTALGREGPAVQIGAGLVSVVARHLRLPAERVQAIIPVGTAAALAAAFNTPIAAVLFTLEEILSDLHARVVGAIVIGSAASWMMLHLLLGDEPLFHVPAYQLVSPLEFLIYAALGILGSLVSTAFVKSLLRLRLWFMGLPKWSVPYQPVAGGLAVGLLAFWVPGVLGVGYEFVGKALNGDMVWKMMLFLLLLKGPMTVICYASGNAGGIFGPSLFIGAMLGGSVGSLAHTLWPGWTAEPGAYALIGMGAVFAGIIRTPMTSVIMIFELTRDYNIIVPLMIANLISYWLSGKLQHTPIYEALSLQEGIHLPRGIERHGERALVVADAMRSPAQLFGPDRKLFEVLGDPRRKTVLVGIDGNLMGVLSPHEIEEASLTHPPEARLAEIRPLLPPLPAELTVDKLPHAHPDQAIECAIERLAAFSLDVLPILDRKDALRVVGEVNMDDLMTAYRLKNPWISAHE
jgi:CIC family chloride channel protein